MYHYYREQLKNSFDLLITQVATFNERSLQAHKAIGFKELKTEVTQGVSWELMVWDWS